MNSVTNGNQDNNLLNEFHQFKREPSAKTRAGLVQSICQQFNDEVFNPGERVIVMEILDFLSRDIERNIRKIVAESLKENPDIPHEVAMRMASDVEEVSVPILQYSSVLDDDDLESIICNVEDIGKLVAIAKRETVSPRISGQLVNTEQEEVVANLAENEGAKLSEESMKRVLDVFQSSEHIMSKMVKRGDLSPTIAEQMVTMVSHKLQKQLVKRYDINPQLAKVSVSEGQETLTMREIYRYLDRDETLKLVKRLHQAERLTPSLILRALCNANINFFETGLATLADIPVPNASKLIRTGDKKSFEALYNKANMPGTMREATAALLEHVVQNLPPKDTQPSRLYFGEIVQRIIGAGQDKNIPNMRYLLALIGKTTDDNKI